MNEKFKQQVIEDVIEWAPTDNQSLRWFVSKPNTGLLPGPFAGRVHSDIPTTRTHFRHTAPKLICHFCEKVAQGNFVDDDGEVCDVCESQFSKPNPNQDEGISLPNPIHDFRLEVLRDGRSVIHPDSNQAKLWMIAYLDDNGSLDRFGTCGFVMTADESDAVIAGMERAKLMSEFAVNQGLEELHQQQLNWDQQEQEDAS